MFAPFFTKDRHYGCLWVSLVALGVRFVRTRNIQFQKKKQAQTDHINRSGFQIPFVLKTKDHFMRINEVLIFIIIAKASMACPSVSISLFLYASILILFLRKYKQDLHIVNARPRICEQMKYELNGYRSIDLHCK